MVVKIKDMQTEIDAIFKSNIFLMEIASISKLQFYTWLDSFKTYETIRAAHRFVFGSTGSGVCTKDSFGRKVIVANGVYAQLLPTQWENMFITSPNQTNVLLLKEACKHMKLTWMKRPIKKRGTE